MSSWERARYIPWSKIPQDGNDLENQKERIFRELQRENQQTQQTATTENTNGGGAAANKTAAVITTKEPYSNIELLRQAAFGSCIGAITGCVFGFMDGMRTAGQSTVLQKASNMAKFKYLMQGTTRSGSVFGAFFGGFHVVKYATRVTLNPGEAGEIVMGGAVSMGALMAKPTFRPFAAYGGMLIFMDVAHILMREYDKVA